MQTGLRQVPPAPDAPGHRDSGPSLQFGPESAQFSAIEMRDAIEEATDGGLVAPDPFINFDLERARVVGGLVGAGTPVTLSPAVPPSGLPWGGVSSFVIRGLLSTWGAPIGESFGGVPLGRVGIFA